MKRSIKSLLTLALAALTGWMWAAELVIPYSFDGKAGNTDIPYEYQVKMPDTALTTFTTTIRYSGGSHRVEILGVKLIDGETEYTAVATGTDGTVVADEGSYSGGNNYLNVFTFTNEEGFTANKVYTLQAMLKVKEGTPSHQGNIKVSGGITLYVPPYSFGVNFTVGGDAISTTEGAGFTKGTYAKPTNWGNFTGSASGNGTMTVEENTIKVYWTARGTWNSGTDKSTDESKLLHGYLDDTVNSGRTKATVTITGLPSDKQYAVALILSGDGANNTDFNGKFSPALINGQTYSYVDGVLVSGDAAKADNAKKWGDRSKAAAAAGLVEGTNVMFVEGLSGSILTITSAMDAQNTSRLTIAGVQVWTTEDTPVAPTAPVDKEVVSLNFYSEQGSVSGAAGLLSAQGWENLAANGTETTLAVWNGEEAVNYPISLTYSSANGYQYTGGVTDNYIKGYLDDGGSQAQVTVENIPFEEYSVIVYAATDTENLKFKPILINGSYYAGVATPTAYGYADLVLEGEQNLRIWGGSRNPVAAYGKNALRVDGLTDSTLSIKGGTNGDGARGGIAAVQIINTGAALPDEQVIDWTAQPADQVKVSALPELNNPFVKLKLADGVTLVVDAAIPAGHLIEIVGNNVAVNITKIELGKADVEAIVSGATSVTTSYTETLGYIRDGVTYPLIFRGTTDANWATLSNWYIGTRTQGETTYWIPYTGTVVPGAPNSNEWRATLVDGELMAIAGEDGYKTVTLPTLANGNAQYEGWATKIAAYNGAHIVIAKANKFQSSAESGPGFLRVDNTSKITFQAYGNGNGGGDKSIHVNAKNGVVFAEGTTSGIQNMTYYFDGDGSVAFATLNQAQKIAGLVLDLGTADEGRKIVSRKLIGFTAGNATFNVADGAVTTTAEDVTLATAEILQNVGQYKFEQKNDGYYVSYVAYAETDEIGDMNTWTAKVDGNWNTAGNWSSGFVPASGKNATIAITADTTITIPAEVTVDNLTVTGDGTLTIAGGKLTATKIYANANIAAGETTLALAPMNIAEGKTVTYTTTTTVVNGDDISNTHALTLKDVTGAGTFVKDGTGTMAFFYDAANVTTPIVVNAGDLKVRGAEGNQNVKLNVTVKKDALLRLAAWMAAFTNDANSIKLEGGAQLWLTNGAALAGTITIENAAETPAKICGSSFEKNGVTISAAITGAGKVEFADGGAFNPTYTNDIFPCEYATTYSGVISGELQVIISDTSAVTFTGANTYSGGTIVAEGATLTAPMRSATPMEINGTLVCNYAASSSLNDNDYSQVTGKGTINIISTGWVYLPGPDKLFASTLALKNDVRGGIVFADKTNVYNIGTLSGTGDFRSDMGDAGTATLRVTQRSATEYSGVLQHSTSSGKIRTVELIVAGDTTVADDVTLTLSGTSTAKAPLTIDATGSLNLTGTWADVVTVDGTIAGNGTIAGVLKLQGSAVLDVSNGPLTVNDLWFVKDNSAAVTVNFADGATAGTVVLKSAKITDNLLADLSKRAPTDLRCVKADDGVSIVLAPNTVNVTIPDAPANTKWYDADGNVVEADSIAVDPNTDVTLTLKADEGYVFADGSTEKEVTVNSGAEGAEITTPDVTAATPVAEANGTKYQTLDAAIAAAQTGATVKLLADVDITKFVTINKSITLDLAGNSITRTDATDNSTALYVNDANATVTITGEGSVTADHTVYVNAGTVIIENGTFEAGSHAVYVQGTGNAVIEGGTFSTEDGPYHYVLNEYDATRDATSIVVKGGKFLDFNPANNDAEGANTNFCAEGYIVVAGEGEEAGYYVVVEIPETAVAMIGKADYDTLAGALAAAQAGQIITLVKDITASEIITIEKAITLDGNGKTLTSTANRAINVDCAGEVTIKNLTIDAGERAINIINQAATVTINGVTATADNVAVMIATSAGAAQVSIADSELTGLMVVGVYGAGADVDIANSTIANVDANDDENYGAITVGDSADGATVDVTNTTITTKDDSKKAYNFNSTATITGVDEVGVVVAMIGEAGYDTIEEAAGDVKAGQTIVLKTDVTAKKALAIAGTLDLNGKTFTGDCLGTVKVNGGMYVTSQGYKMVGPTAEYYQSSDAVFTMVDIQGSITLNAGTLTVVPDVWWTGADQTLTIAQGATFVIPAGKQMNVLCDVIANGTLTIEGTANLYSADATIKAPEGLNVVTSVAGCEVDYADGVYTVVESIVLDDVIAATPAAEAIKAAMEAAGVTKIESYIITTKGADTAADADKVAAVLEIFEVTPEVEANGELSVAYEFGISNIKNNGNGTVDITAGVTGAEYRAGVTVTFTANGDVIGTATTTADSTTVTVEDINAEDIKGKTIFVKAEK